LELSGLRCQIPAMLTFLWIDPTPIRGPLTFARLRELWDAGEITGESKLFVTDRDDATNKVRCLNIKAETIRHNLETGDEINMESLKPPEGW
jgi:hypothetical protein